MQNNNSKLKYTILLAIFFSLVGVGQNSSPLLDYHYGNQIFQSMLQIDNHGNISHSERKCCPPHVYKLKESALGSAELNSLNREISEAFQRPVISSKGKETTEGSQSGSLTVYNENKKAILIHSIERGQGSVRQDWVKKNQSSAATKIESLVNRYVQHPMYQ